jgi:tyrosyl-tRNA synthetase
VVKPAVKLFIILLSVVMVDRKLSSLDHENSVRLVMRNVEEIITKSDLETLLSEKEKPRTYIGFETSGFLHVGVGLVCGRKLLDFIEAGFETIIFFADWHSWINNKLGGDFDKIKRACEYFIEAFKSLGIKGELVRYVTASDLTKQEEYWETVVRIAKSASLKRVLRCLPIMGREMGIEDIESAWVYYPAMQVADIFFMGIDVAAGGMDQRKAHMLARDVAEKLGYRKPMAVHIPLLTGLEGRGSKMEFDEQPDLAAKISAKMSKSKPDTCIFIHDSPEDIKRKIRKAFCPPQILDGNPVAEMVSYIIFPYLGKIGLERSEKHGGTIVFEKEEDFKKAYLKGEIHPLDLKNGVTSSLISILEPSRRYFEKTPKAKKLLEEMNTYVQ